LSDTVPAFSFFSFFLVSSFLSFSLLPRGFTSPHSSFRAKELFNELIYDGINVDIIHSSRSAQQREEIIRRFRSGEIWILICTDLLARGIDFYGVQMVINYDLPLTAVSYIHRIGRTGSSLFRRPFSGLFDKYYSSFVLSLSASFGCHSVFSFLCLLDLAVRRKSWSRRRSGNLLYGR
jgi:hypothetical protein